MATTILIVVLIISLGVSVWLGMKYAQAKHEFTRINSLKELQLKYIEYLIKSLENNKKLEELLKKISEAKDETELNDIYNDIIS